MPKQEEHRLTHAMFLSPVLTPCLAECIMHHSSIVFHTLLPVQGARGAAMSQTRLQCCPIQQTSASANPGAELFLAVPHGTICPSQKPSSPNPPATGSQPESVQRSWIHGWGRSRDTSVSFGITRTPPTPPELLLYLAFHSLILPYSPWGCAEAEWDYFEKILSFNFCLMALCSRIMEVGW